MDLVPRAEEYTYLCTFLAPQTATHQIVVIACLEYLLSSNKLKLARDWGLIKISPLMPQFYYTKPNNIITDKQNINKT